VRLEFSRRCVYNFHVSEPSIKSLLEDDKEPEGQPGDPGSGSTSGYLNISGASFEDEERKPKPEPFVLSEAPPESYAETVRKSGLAWSAGIAFFGSVVFLMIIGWIADVLLGSSPWGIVGGIVVGSLLGFVQFFRITSQIFKK
jgi:hypothetical protein